jgi:hypothetical protein
MILLTHLALGTGVGTVPSVDVLTIFARFEAFALSAIKDIETERVAGEWPTFYFNRDGSELGIRFPQTKDCLAPANN